MGETKKSILFSLKLYTNSTITSAVTVIIPLPIRPDYLHLSVIVYRSYSKAISKYVVGFFSFPLVLLESRQSHPGSLKK